MFSIRLKDRYDIFIKIVNPSSHTFHLFSRCTIFTLRVLLPIQWMRSSSGCATVLTAVGESVKKRDPFEHVSRHAFCLLWQCVFAVYEKVKKEEGCLAKSNDRVYVQR